MIIGRDLIRCLGIDIHGVDMTIHWEDSAILWREIDSTTNDVFALSQYKAPFKSEINRMKCIIDAKYSKSDLKTITEISTHLDPQEINELYILLKKYEYLFDGNLGTWYGNPYDIKLKPDVEPYHGKTFPVPHIHELTFKQELDWLEALKVIMKVNRSQWGAPRFLIPRKYEHQKCFNAIKRVIGSEVLLAYPDLNAPFEINTDAFKLQIGAAISQKGKPINLYSWKINSAQHNYTTTEKEILSIVTTLKEFRNILLGHQIMVYTDHKNLTYNFFNTGRVMRWNLILEEFESELKYIKGENNVVSDALSRLEMSDNQEIINISEIYWYDEADLPNSAYPICYHDISKA